MHVINSSYDLHLHTKTLTHFFGYFIRLVSTSRASVLKALSPPGRRRKRRKTKPP